VFTFGGSAFYPALTLHMQPWVGFPHTLIVSPTEPNSGQSSSEDTAELVKKMEERWKFDSDALPDNTRHEARTIIDDFDYRFVFSSFGSNLRLMPKHRQSNQRYALVKEREWLFQPDMSRAQVDQRNHLTAPLQDALNSQPNTMQNAGTLGTSGAPVMAGSAQPRLSMPNAAASIRPPNAPPGLPPQALPRTPQQQQVANYLLQQQFREKQQQVAHAQAQAAAATQVQVAHSQSQANGSAQSSPQTANPQPSPSQPPPQPLTLGNGTPGVPVSAPFAPYQVNGVNGVAGSPPKPVVNGYHQSPLPSPHPPSVGLAGADAGTIVRVSTPIRKPTMPLQPSSNMQINGYHGMAANPGNVPNGYGGFNQVGGMSVGMYNNLQNIKMINQHNQMMAQYQMQSQMTPLQVQQQQHFQQQQQLQQQQQMQHQLQLIQMQQQAGNLMNPAMQGHFSDMAQTQHLMGVQQASQQMHGQNLFSVGMTPGMSNNTSAMNMSVQNINLQLGPQNIPLRLPPNRAQQQQGMIPRPSTAMGNDFGMAMANGASPMMQGMVMGNPQMAAAMSIVRAPSTPLSLRSNGGLLPNNGMLMGRGQPTASMQSPMMRPTSAASMHSNMGMQMQPGASLPVSLQGSPANMPQTPHLRQQTVPGS
jgi:hypothetical protein